MARYKQENRYELFVEGSLEELLPDNSVARSIRMALQGLDFSSFDAQHQNDEVGRHGLDPRSLAGVWILALLRGVGSSVVLARHCKQDIEFRWMLGGNTVEKSLLCDFRKNHLESVANLGGQVLVALGACGLLPGTSLGVDGTVVRAASSRRSVVRRKTLKQRVKHVEDVLREKLSAPEGLDETREAELNQRRERSRELLSQMDALGLEQEDDRLTTTEPDARLLRQKDGSFAPGHNIQAVVDLDSGVLVHAEVVSGGSDSGQLQPQIEQARAVLARVSPEGEAAVQSVVADAAYHDVRQLSALEEGGMACYVPEDRNAHRVAPGIAPEYQARNFAYDEQTDTMRCPQGRLLRRSHLNDRKTSAVYRSAAHACDACPAKPQCCPESKTGRRVNRSLYLDVSNRVSERLQSDEAKPLLQARWVSCEGLFARVNHLLHWKRNRMWGQAGVRAELAWRQLAHNLMLLAGAWKPMVAEGMTAQ